MSIESKEHCICRFDDGRIAVTKVLKDGNWVVRHYHSNGRIKREIPTRDGREHGTVRQWSEKGELLGSYQMNEGTGVATEWYENGSLKGRTTMLEGLPNGRVEFWDEKGILSLGFMLDGELVDAETYADACAINPKLPRY